MLQFNHPYLSDLTLELVDSNGRDTAKVHRVVLSSKSPYFETLFSSSMKEVGLINQLKPIELKVESVPIAMKLLEWLYQPPVVSQSDLDWSSFPLEASQLAEMWLISLRGLPQMSEVECFDYYFIIKNIHYLLRLSANLIIGTDETPVISLKDYYPSDPLVSCHDEFLIDAVNQFVSIMEWSPAKFIEKHFSETGLYYRRKLYVTSINQYLDNLSYQMSHILCRNGKSSPLAFKLCCQYLIFGVSKDIDLNQLLLVIENEYEQTKLLASTMNELDRKICKIVNKLTAEDFTNEDFTAEDFTDEVEPIDKYYPEERCVGLLASAKLNHSIYEDDDGDDYNDGMFLYELGGFYTPG